MAAQKSLFLADTFGTKKLKAETTVLFSWQLFSQQRQRETVIELRIPYTFLHSPAVLEMFHMTCFSICLYDTVYTHVATEATKIHMLLQKEQIDAHDLVHTCIQCFTHHTPISTFLYFNIFFNVLDLDQICIWWYQTRHANRTKT